MKNSGTLIMLTEEENAVLQARLRGIQVKQLESVTGMKLHNARYHNTKVLWKFGATDIEDIRLMFGHTEMRPVWVPAENPPKVVVHKTKRTRRLVK